MRRVRLPGDRWPPEKVERFLRDWDELSSTAMAEKYGAPAWKLAFILRSRGVTVPTRPGRRTT